MDKKAVAVPVTVLLALSVLGLVVFTGGDDSEPVLHDSYNLNSENENLTFLIGESRLLQSKTGDDSGEGVFSKLISTAENLPLVSHDLVWDNLERVYLGLIGSDISEGKIVQLSDGEISSTHVEDELIVHVIQEAGTESEYDFYAGTYDNGVLIGGSFEDDGSFSYETIAELDDRVRELDIADVTDNGEEELLVTTHYDGITAVYSPQNDWEETVIDKEHYGKGDTYSHEVKAGDITGDGKKEIVATPSEPNTWEDEQKGVIKMFSYSNGDWNTIETDELERSHIRKVVLNSEDNSIIGGAAQRDSPYTRDASLIKYGYEDGELVEKNETVFEDPLRNLYPFLVERSEGNLVVGLSSDSQAVVVNAETMEHLYTESFSQGFEEFYSATSFDYTGNSEEELLITQDGNIVIYEVTEEEMVELERIEVYDSFDFSIIWSSEVIER